tara:strand:- start:1380 stop:2279 length:900 start_codon:yes stop_codon:yes gene_type:complete
MAIKFYTVATHSPSGFERLMQSAEFYGIDLTVLGVGQQWVGQGQKINLFKNELAKLNDDDIVGFVDGFDIVFLTHETEIEKKFHELTRSYKWIDTRPLIQCPICVKTDANTQCMVRDESEEAADEYGHPLWAEVQTAKVVFGAEENCEPDSSLINRFPNKEGFDIEDHNYRFLNSGNLIGEVGELKRITEEVIADADNDQLYYQKKFLAGKPNIYGEVDGHEDLDSVSSFEIILDYGSQIFQCMKGGGTEIVDNVAYQHNPNEYIYVAPGAEALEMRWFYREDARFPCILHGHNKERNG